MASARLARHTLVFGAAAGPLVVVLPLSDQFALPKLAFGLLIAGVLAMAVPAGVMTRRLRIHPLPTLLAAAFALVLLLATLASDHPRASVVGTHADYSGLLAYVPGLVCFLAAIGLIRSVASLERLVSAVALLAVPVLAYALVQSAGFDPVDWDQDFGRRSFSTLGQPLVLGGYAAMLIPMLGWLALRRSGGERTFLLGEAVVALVVLGLTGTRGAWLAAGVAAVVLAVLVVPRSRLWRRPSAPLVAVAATVVIIGLVAALQIAPDRLRSQQTLDERTDLWRGSLAMAAERPLLGWGPDQFATNYGMFRPSPERGTQSPYEQPAANPHNEVLTLLVAGGLPLAGLYVVLWLVPVAGAPRARGSPARAMAVAWLLAVLAAYFVQAQFSIPDVSLHVLAMTLLGALVGLTSAGRRISPRDRLPWPAHAPVLAAGAMSCAVAFVLVAADAVHAAGMRAHPASPEAVSRIGAATRLNPFQARYLDDLAATHELRAPVHDPQAQLTRALDLYERRIGRFGGTVAHHLAAARAALLLRRLHPEAANRHQHHIAEARRLDPENPGLEQAIADVSAP